MAIASPYLQLLKDRITLTQIPFTDRDSRLILFRSDEQSLWVGLAEYEIDPEQYPAITRWSFTDGEGQACRCEYTTYPHEIRNQTPCGTFRITFVDAETLLVALPAGRSGIKLLTRMEKGQTDRLGGVLGRSSYSPLHLVYTTNTTLIQNCIVELDNEQREIELIFEAEEGAVLLLNITRTADFNRRIVKAEQAIEAAAQRWHDWFATVPEVAEHYRRQYYYAWWVMGANLIYPYAHPKREGMVPSKQGYVGIWHWDSYFHALALRHRDTQMAQEQFRIMLDYQLPNGLIPDIVHDEGILAHTTEIVEADITKPPLTAWAAWKVYEIDGDREFLKELYEPIVRFQNWWFSESDPDVTGLCAYLHPWSSGLDNNPLWDQGLPVETPDLSAYLCLQYDYLARIAQEIGYPEEALDWTQRAKELAERMIALRWDEQAGIFWASRHGQRIPVCTPFHLFPLITGRMPENIAARLVATLTNEKKFWGHHPVPTVAFDDPSFNPLSMWRGPVWLNVNYLLIDGLLRAGYPEQARELRWRTLELALAAEDFYEYYHPLTGQKPPRATHAFGWSAALFIDLVIAASAEQE
ncbi:glycogen debranching protein [Ktedonosporobacter rubrisoli]|uniref:Glycogen debranching protein n=1 Tax=Ktedonosporobacter rubrisoli TaxID=2509675 RepID=A0A4P6JI16_KTERU|nr:trehalase family glycosidase [Ktedonosporobacter rubrisoli]QBD74510.1 glycogen debranching protein [Ktedonosporobacter rubrisoli]